MEFFKEPMLVVISSLFQIIEITQKYMKKGCSSGQKNAKKIKSNPKKLKFLNDSCMVINDGDLFMLVIYLCYKVRLS